MAQRLKIAFIVGCARSGTSILGKVLGQHPDIHYIGEHNQVLWHKAGCDHHERGAGDVTWRVAAAFRDAIAQQTPDGKLLLDKCPPNSLRIPFLAKLFPEAWFIHAYRDGRDVACSLSPGIGGENWMHLKPANWRQIQQDYQGVLRGAMLWKTVIEHVETATRTTPGLIFPFRYERFLKNCEDINRVLNRLNLSPSEKVYQFWRDHVTEVAPPARVDDPWYQPNHQYTIGRWREQMTFAEKQQVKLLLDEPLRKYNYL